MVLSLTYGREGCKIIKSYGNDDDDDTGTNRIHKKNYLVLIGLDKCSFQVIQCRRGLIQRKEVTNQTEQFLELFSRTLNFFAP